MTLYLTCRSQSVGGAIVDPYLLEGNGTEAPPALKTVAWADIAAKVAGKDVLLGVHGFNVNYRSGANSFGLLDGSLGLAESEVFIGVLWPGDFWMPAGDYPFEGSDAMECGRPPAGPPVTSPCQIQDGYGYRHGSYLPPTDPALFSQRVTDFVRRAFHGQPQPRPGALD